MRHVLLHRRDLLRHTTAWGIAASTLWGQPARASVWMSSEQAMHTLIPEAQDFVPCEVNLNEAQRAHIAQRTDTRVPPSFAPRVWSARRHGQGLGWVMLDRVIGKYDWIDYAAAFDTQGVSLGLEVLAYRESHGGEIRQTRWRGQFVGRKDPQALRWGDDIRNISGATLSCQHVTEGVQRLSALARLLP
jgi:Na+-translocating ferredoxin:NAD+ oxidoreductase RnfG subunit